MRLYPFLSALIAAAAIAGSAPAVRAENAPISPSISGGTSSDISSDTMLPLSNSTADSILSGASPISSGQGKSSTTSPATTTPSPAAAVYASSAAASPTPKSTPVAPNVEDDEQIPELASFAIIAVVAGLLIIGVALFLIRRDRKLGTKPRRA